MKGARRLGVTALSRLPFVAGLACSLSLSMSMACRSDAPPGDATQVGCSYLGLPGDVVPGDTLLLDDGLIGLRVVRVEGESVHKIGRASCRERV